jgi:hypothetical protein
MSFLFGVLQQQMEPPPALLSLRADGVPARCRVAREAIQGPSPTREFGPDQLVEERMGRSVAATSNALDPGNRRGENAFPVER